MSPDNKISKPYRIALTGGMGSGKSTVTDIFSSLGVPIIDSDVISRDLVNPGQPALIAIQNHFGNKIITKNGFLDRKKLGEIIFSDLTARQKLDSILHPKIYSEIDKQLKNIDYPYCLIVIPLLIETGEYNRYDRILLIDTDRKNQIRRITKRDNLTKTAAQNILKAQTTRENRLKYADDIIDNNNIEIDKLEFIIKELHKKYLNLCKI